MISRICAHCGKSFSVKTSDVKRGGGIFCSNSCRAKNNQVGSSNSKFKGLVTRECEVCGKKFSAVPSLVSAGFARFCSRACQGKHKSKLYIGEKSHAWKGGITEVHFHVRSSTRYKSWRQSIFLRDDFTCTKCGQRGGDLAAHHVKPFSRLLDEVKVNIPLLPVKDAAMIYSPLWDLDNGNTLCQKCHREIHSLGGGDGKRS